MGVISELWNERKVLKLLVQRDLRVRYAQSFLGYLWTVIDPLSNALIYFVIFGYIFNGRDVGHDPYFLFLIAGLLPWQWFNAAVNEAMRALISERQLVRSTSLPREIWVLRIVASKGLEFIYSLPVLVLFVGFYLWRGEAQIDWELLYWPLAIILQFVLILGVGLILAPLTVLIFDIQPTVRIALRVLFYATPILFNLQAVDKIPDSLSWIFQLNPLTGIMEVYRAGLFVADIEWGVVGISAVITVFTFLLGLWTFRRLEPAMLKEI